MMIHQAWQSARPQYDTYSDVFDAYPQILPQSLLDLQPRLNLSLKRFVANNEQKLLLVNMPDALVYRQLLAQRLQELATPASAVITSESIDVQDYLGQYQVEADHKIQLLPGLFDQADNGIIMISANLILANPRQWPQLKAVILGQAAHALPVDPHKIYPKLEEKHYQLQCVITGDREQLAHLEEIDDMLRPPHCLFGELELEYRFEKAQASNYLAYIKHMVNQSQVDDLADHAAISAYLQFGARITEDQCYMPLSPVWHQSLLTEAMYVKQTSGDESTGISAQNLNQAIENQELRHGYLPHRALEDICEGQVIIETQGQRVGQVNGLTVVEVSGHPTSYGEPARISCVVHLGDGDVSDVEHKTELGGNLHAKGMMIMQAFLTSAMNLDEPLPFAASIVFEQSYSEVDGDSASMAELTALVSALSDTPVNQHIAVTGAVDQFGRV
ncbi:MAG: AAA family ATPase, partial [Vibrio sp.]